jgi:hypothetical protein
MSALGYVFYFDTTRSNLLRPDKSGFSRLHQNERDIRIVEKEWLPITSLLKENEGFYIEFEGNGGYGNLSLVDKSRSPSILKINSGDYTGSWTISNLKIMSNPLFNRYFHFYFSIREHQKVMGACGIECTNYIHDRSREYLI